MWLSCYLDQQKRQKLYLVIPYLGGLNVQRQKVCYPPCFCCHTFSCEVKRLKKGVSFIHQSSPHMPENKAVKVQVCVENLHCSTSLPLLTCSWGEQRNNWGGKASTPSLTQCLDHLDTEALIRTTVFSGI